MSHYRHNLRDVEFNLFEVFGRDQVLGSAPFEEIDGETAREMLREMARLATDDLAPSAIESDRNPPVFHPETHSVTLPESFKQAYRAYLESGFWQMGLPEEVGGVSAPSSLRWGMLEFLLGANPAVLMYAMGMTFSTTLHHFGTPQQQRLAQLMVEKRWGATMVLTEPDAGSDVGAGRTKAVAQPDGTWHISGVKRFITAGEHDLADNIVHFVLARPEGAGPGTKGLSLFMVPKFHVDLETGELGERNGAFITNVEHKMGLKVSTTCELRFGEVDGVPAVGTLLGDVHHGIAQMFDIIEGARMMVGTKAIATLSTGYLNALEYAKERVQGADLTQMQDKAAPRVTITHHPDVRRSLMTQKAYAEGLRALVHLTSVQQDAVKVAEARGERDEDAERLNDFLLPIVKGVGSERAFTLLGSESLQTFGGSGFLQDYPLEQYVRDSKIDTLYEGTTAIQGTDFFFRKIVRDKGRALSLITEQITEFAKADPGDGRLATQREALGHACENFQGMVAHLLKVVRSADTRAEGADVTNIYKVGQNTTRLLMAAGDLLVGWLLLRQADVALTALEGSAKAADRAFYQGKVAAATYFAAQVLPHLAVERAILESTDNALMDLPEEAF
ncbi:acyl-CoA dehydrogenase [Kineosporia sp. NBRC 101677]|uniref:acyl-CoA dehydrogenase n=1 Tax=Kineosporia sp. NBRC 101677 TaxID=3032197 RepID=UPI0024A4024F|nr:acyl-CoA dehydrogenase [Kineosporia sp. NBRC 101677]GLY14012.1 acyl-CoA dehydrogenase [Kineosporia sp. NBRC 101677]